MRRIAATFLSLTIAFTILLPAPQAAAQSAVADASRHRIWSFPPELRAPTPDETDQMRSRWERMGTEMQAERWDTFYVLAETDFSQKQATYGPNHPVTGIAANMLAVASLRLNRNEDATYWANEAIRILAAALSPSDVSLVGPYGYLAEAQWRQGLLQPAERNLRRSNEIARSNGEEYLELHSRRMLVDLLDEQGRSAEAEALRRRE